MAGDPFRFEPLGEQHRALREGFSCGVVALDRYLQTQATQEMRRGVAVACVLFDARLTVIAGFYTLSAASIEPTSLPETVSRKLPRYPALPAILTGRLAVDIRYRGRGLGQMLLFDSLRRSLDLSRSIGAMTVIVDAKDESACAFYERYGFQRFVDQERHLFIPMSTVTQVLV